MHIFFEVIWNRSYFGEVQVGSTGWSVCTYLVTYQLSLIFEKKIKRVVEGISYLIILWNVQACIFEILLKTKLQALSLIWYSLASNQQFIPWKLQKAQIGELLEVHMTFYWSPWYTQHAIKLYNFYPLYSLPQETLQSPVCFILVYLDWNSFS